MNRDQTGPLVSAFNLGHAANVIVRALIPIFGVTFLGWSGTKLHC